MLIWFNYFVSVLWFAGAGCVVCLGYSLSSISADPALLLSPDRTWFDRNFHLAFYAAAIWMLWRSWKELSLAISEQVSNTASKTSEQIVSTSRHVPVVSPRRPLTLDEAQQGRRMVEALQSYSILPRDLDVEIVVKHMGTMFDKPCMSADGCLMAIGELVALEEIPGPIPNLLDIQFHVEEETNRYIEIMQRLSDMTHGIMPFTDVKAKITDATVPLQPASSLDSEELYHPSLRTLRYRGEITFQLEDTRWCWQFPVDGKWFNLDVVSEVNRLLGTRTNDYRFAIMQVDMDAWIVFLKVGELDSLNAKIDANDLIKFEWLEAIGNMFGNFNVSKGSLPYRIEAKRESQ